MNLDGQEASAVLPEAKLRPTGLFIQALGLRCLGGDEILTEEPLGHALGGLGVVGLVGQDAYMECEAYKEILPAPF